QVRLPFIRANPPAEITKRWLGQEGWVGQRSGRERGPGGVRDPGGRHVDSIHPGGGYAPAFSGIRRRPSSPVNVVENAFLLSLLRSPGSVSVTLRVVREPVTPDAERPGRHSDGGTGETSEIIPDRTDHPRWPGLGSATPGERRRARPGSRTNPGHPAPEDAR